MNSQDDLTPEQQAGIITIVDKASQAIWQASNRSAGKSRKQKSQQRTSILNSARDEVLGLLDGEQRNRWDEIDEQPILGTPSP